MRKADYAVAIVYEKSTKESIVQRSVFALRIDHDRIEVDDGGSLGIYGVCAQKGSQEYEELVNKKLEIEITPKTCTLLDKMRRLNALSDNAFLPLLLSFYHTA